VSSPRPRTRRHLALAAGIAVAGLALAGCSATNDITTQLEYSASDGVRVTLGDVRGSNLLVVTDAEGRPGLLIGAFTNDGEETRTVTVTVGGGTQSTLRVDPRATVLLDGTVEPGRARVEVPAVDRAPGGVTTITVGTDVAGSTDLQVPVLDDTLGEYGDLLETVSASAPTS